MLRRRLVLSDDEDEEHKNPLRLPSSLPPPQWEEADLHDPEIEAGLPQPAVNYQNPNPNFSEPVVPLSDEEFVDVSDDTNSASPPPEAVSSNASENQQPQPPPAPEESFGCPVGDVLSRMGLRLKREWLDSCLGGLGSSVQHLDVTGKARHCFDKFLISNLNYCGAGVLPLNVDAMHLVDLPGPFVLQVDEIVNLSAPLKSRYEDAHCGLKRCLKLSMTDGVQRVFGIEYRPIRDLKVLAPAGFKMALRNVHVRRGLLMLVPEVLEILGGMVEELDGARQRLVEEVNKPPRGKRARAGVNPPLATRATLAAWPLSAINDQGNTTNGSDNSLGTSTSTINPGLANERYDRSANVAGCSNVPTNCSRSSAHSTLHTAIPFSGGGSNNPINISRSQNPSTVQRAISSSINVPSGSNNSSNVSRSTNPTSASSSNFSGGSNSPVDAFRSTNSSTIQTGGPSQSHDQGNRLVTLRTNSSQCTTNGHDNGRAGLCAASLSDRVVSEVEGMHIDASSPVLRESAASDQEDTLMVDELEHPLILSGDQKIPFTYLASLSAKWASTRMKSSVQGKIKCLITGVKGFQYRQRETYDLRIYVDDGSLISEILVHHNVVTKAIGYSPIEVTSALSSKDVKRVGDMKDTMRQFQVFLANFEGTMLVEMNGTSSVPVALELDQGSPPADAWLLMERLNKFPSPSQQTAAHHTASETITISP
ncbi:unnamed protein product [Linum tenue]|uniref:RecQ-mediated genome instability protein 1 n=1 Tax=Linum tenue TaxID=586396 RepID=A0AAV0QS74_9ROSI|nr:unnamed protein product [Linum tenue]